MKEDYDGAEPTASSIAALNPLTISHLTGDEGVRTRAERTLARYGPRIGAAGRWIPMMLCALSAWHAGLSQVVVVGPRDRAKPLLEELARHYVPFAIVIPVAHENGTNDIGNLIPFTAAMTDRGSAAAYVCRDFTCRQPVTTVRDLAAQR